MTIDVTLFIQILSFIIVFQLLQRFIFKPATEIIEHDAAIKQTQLDLLDEGAKSLQEQEHTLKQYMVKMRHTLLQLFPRSTHIKVDVPHHIDTHVEIGDLPAAEQANIKEKIITTLLEKK